MKKYLTLAVAILLLGGVGLANAAGVTFNFASGSQINFASGGQINISAPFNGTVTGFNINENGVCGGSTLKFKLMNAVGATVDRINVVWNGVQSTSSASYMWAVQDCKVNDAVAAGITPLVIIHDTPDWAADVGCTVNPGQANCAPKDAATVTTWCSALATHYNGKVTYWEFWNEPNVFVNWGPGANAANFVTYLNACSAAIKAVNPSAKIVFGGLAPAGNTGGDISITNFVTQAYAAGPVNYDIMGQHPYSYPNDLTTGTTATNGWQAMIAVRQTMNANGDTSKPIWITEVGAPTGGPGTAYPLNDSHVSYNNNFMTQLAQQQLFKLIVATSSSPWMNIQQLILYDIMDLDTGSAATTENHFGMCYDNGQCKPAFDAVRN